MKKIYLQMLLTVRAFFSRTLSPPHTLMMSGDNKIQDNDFDFKFLTKFASAYSPVQAQVENEHDKKKSFPFNQNTLF